MDRAGPGYKVIRLRGLSHTDNMARIRQYFHVATDEGRSFPFLLRQIDSILRNSSAPWSGDVCADRVRPLGLGELVRNPFSRWVRGHSQPQDLAAIVMQYQQPVEQSE